MKTLKLEVGKTYLSRKGEEVRIVRANDSEPWPFVGDNDESYTEQGRYYSANSDYPFDLIEEVGSTCHTFSIPDGVKEITLDYFGNRIVMEMVPEEVEPKPGDVMINDWGSVYILKEVRDSYTHRHYAWLKKDGRLSIGASCYPGRPATPEEAQPLWDALKKAGKKWNPETMQVEEIPESTRIREWVEMNIKDGFYNQADVAEAIEAYLKHKEDKK